MQKLLTLKLCHTCAEWAPLVHLAIGRDLLIITVQSMKQGKPGQTAMEVPALRMLQNLRQDEQRWST